MYEIISIFMHEVNKSYCKMNVKRFCGPNNERYHNEGLVFRVLIDIDFEL